MGFYDAIDADWTWDGDYALGDDGDIKDTSYDFIQSLRNDIMTVVKAEIGDWQFVPTYAASLSDFQGEPNTRANGARIQDRVRNSIITAGIADSSDINVRVVPVGYHEILIMIRVLANATPNNSLEVGTPVVISLLYDSIEKGVFFAPQNQLERDFRSGG